MAGSSEFDAEGEGGLVDPDIWTSSATREGRTSSGLADDGNSGVDGGIITGGGEKYCTAEQQPVELWMSDLLQALNPKWRRRERITAPKQIKIVYQKPP